MNYHLGLIRICTKKQDPHPVLYQSEKLVPNPHLHQIKIRMHDPHLDLHQIKYKIRIGTKVISRIPIHMKVMRISNPAFWLVICILMGIRIRIQLITLMGIQILPVNVMLIRNTAFWLVTCILMYCRSGSRSL